MTKQEYFNEILRTTYIQEWCVDAETQTDVINSIIGAYPLPEAITKSDVTTWVREQISEYNCDVDDEQKIILA
jgi:hypothetical protein